jgi:predicted nuclease of predicted toxin-antitoxin system
VKFYFDEHVSSAICAGLRRRGVDVLTVQDDARCGATDVELLDRALELGRVLFTRDEDFLAEATARQQSGAPFSGVIYGHLLNVSIGKCIDDLELIDQACQGGELENQVLFLPL